MADFGRKAFLTVFQQVMCISVSRVKCDFVYVFQPTTPNILSISSAPSSMSVATSAITSVSNTGKQVVVSGNKQQTGQQTGQQQQQQGVQQQQQQQQQQQIHTLGQVSVKFCLPILTSRLRALDFI